MKADSQENCITSNQEKAKPLNDGLYNGQKQINIEDIRKAIPPELFKRSELRFLVSTMFSVSLTLMCGYLAKNYIPLTVGMTPVWLLYALITGTIATGVWVLGHECGHYAFSETWWLNEVLGLILHSSLLVPYFSWQWSHYCHHKRCNHLTQGEGYVPPTADTPKSKFYMRMRDIIGVESFSILLIITLLSIAWPMYLLFGVSGNPSNGFTSHFLVPNKLLGKDKLVKVGISNMGMSVIIYCLYLWAQATSFYEVLAVYIGPYLIVNAYLTGITYLQHTEDEVPHYDETAWTWLKGALCSIDRNYHPAMDYLHHHIGTTHVTHHLFAELPHYNAPLANIYVKQILGDLYYKDKKSLPKAMFEAGKLCCVEHKGNGVWKYI